MEGWRVASKRLGPLPRRRRSALAHGCGWSGRVVLPLARAAVISTGVRVQADAAEQHEAGEGRVHDEDLRDAAQGRGQVLPPTRRHRSRRGCRCGSAQGSGVGEHLG